MNSLPTPASYGVDKGLRHLNRAELLELLLQETKENERLRAELAKVSQRLESREIVLRESGSIAEASLRLNGVFEAAQKAANQYVENVQCRYALAGSPEALEAQTRARCEQMLREAKSQAESYLQNARIQAQRVASANYPTQGSPYATGRDDDRQSKPTRAAHFKSSRTDEGRGSW